MKRQRTLFGWNVCAFAPYEDDLPTDPGGPMLGGMGLDDDAETEIPGGRYRDAGYDVGEEDETQLGRSSVIEEMDATVLDVPETGVLALLWSTEGDRRGRIYRIHDGDIVGKREGDLFVDDPKVSTPHCRFRVEKEKFVVWDCGSKNGTYVNNQRIRCATPLEENDLLKIGDQVFLVKLMK